MYGFELNDGEEIFISSALYNIKNDFTYSILCSTKFCMPSFTIWINTLWIYIWSILFKNDCCVMSDMSLITHIVSLCTVIYAYPIISKSTKKYQIVNPLKSPVAAKRIEQHTALPNNVCQEFLKSNDDNMYW